MAELNGTPEGSGITEAILRLSQVLHLTTVAEGIETADQAAELQLLGCGIGQGYLFAKPLPPAQVTELLAQPFAAAFISFLNARTLASDSSSTMSATDRCEPSSP